MLSVLLGVELQDQVEKLRGAADDRQRASGVERLHYGGRNLRKATTHDWPVSQSDPRRMPLVSAGSHDFIHDKDLPMKAVSIDYLAEGNVQPWRVSIPGADAYFATEGEATEYADLLEARIGASHPWPEDEIEDPSVDSSR